MRPKFTVFNRVRFVRDVGTPEWHRDVSIIERPGPIRPWAYKGEIETVIEVYLTPREGYEIEVMKGGSYYSLALVTAGPDDLELASEAGQHPM